MYTYTNDFQAFITARDAGGKCHIDERMHDYFLGVLPPIYMSRDITLPTGETKQVTFCFAEGAETITAFWRESGNYYAQRTNIRSPRA